MTFCSPLIYSLKYTNTQTASYSECEKLLVVQSREDYKTLKVGNSLSKVGKTKQ